MVVVKSAFIFFSKLGKYAVSVYVTLLPQQLEVMHSGWRVITAEIRRMWKETAVVSLRIFPERMKKADLNLDGWSPSPESNPILFEYEAHNGEVQK
jgi:hypothetical protein